MSQNKIIKLVRAEMEPFLKREGYVLYHIEYVKEGKDWFLRIFIEKAPVKGERWPANVTMEDCEKASRFISGRLDEIDPVKQNYYLEVSSPGLDRPLLKDEDFIRYTGNLVDVRLYKSINGEKVFTGRLLGFDNDILEIEKVCGKMLSIPRNNISLIRLTVVF